MKYIYKVAIGFYIITMILTSKAYGSLKDKEYILNMKRDLLVLMLAYPECISSIEKDDRGLIYLVMIDNKKILYDDMANKNREQRFYNTDLEDTLIEIYPLDKMNGIMKDNKDPGRARCYSFLKAMYGESRDKIERKLIYVPTYYGDIMFNKVNGASKRIQEALNAVGELVKTKPEVGGFVTPLSGTYNYRVIQDTGQLSPHSFGIAIDLKRDDADYWKWGKPDLANKRIQNYPKELVDIFEEQGFVWGGKWAHFDILHFEYRPEILLKARYFRESSVGTNKWYSGAPKDERTKELIKIIDNIIDN